jgi:hypothetical protein
VRIDAGSSSGRTHRIAIARFGNQFIYLASDAEFAVFLMEYFDEEVTHIETQVDCEPEATQRIADSLGIKHPRNHAGKPWTISTDMIVTRTLKGRTSRRANNIKAHGFDVRNRRFRCICSIEDRYHRERGTSWCLAVSRGLNTAWARNYAWLFPVSNHYYARGFNERQMYVQDLVLARLAKPRYASTVREVGQHATAAFGLGPGEAVRAIRELLATRQIWSDMNSPDLLDQSPSAMRVDRARRSLVASTIP